MKRNLNQDFVSNIYIIFDLHTKIKYNAKLTINTGNKNVFATSWITISQKVYGGLATNIKAQRSGSCIRLLNIKASQLEYVIKKIFLINPKQK